VLESDLVAERELASGGLVSHLRHKSNSVRSVCHYFVHPRGPRLLNLVHVFKEWLFKELVEVEIPGGDNLETSRGINALSMPGG